MEKQTDYTFQDDRHPYIDIHSVMPEDKWLSKKEIGKKFRADLGFKIAGMQLDRAFKYLRKYGLVEHRIREIRPLKGFTVKDVLKKITHGTANVNTGVLIYEYRRTDKCPEMDFKRLVEHSRNNRKTKPKKTKQWSQARLFSPEEAMYIKMNPDRMSSYMMAKMFGVNANTIKRIWKGESYKDLDLEKYMPIREEIFSQIKSDRYDFFTENNI